MEGHVGVMAPSPRPAFGKRTAAPAPAVVRNVPAAEEKPVNGIGWVDQNHDPELAAWKQARRWQPPWRQISLIASLCFGIAGLVLPDSVSDPVQCGLYALAGLSLVSGLRKRQ